MSPSPSVQESSHSQKPFLATLDGHAVGKPPVWLMRQAGRYLPEYRAIRCKAESFLNFCYTPALATEATLQPIRRFGFDAAILFSDILVVPDALGQKVSFETGEGPRLDALTSPDAIERLSELSFNRLAPVFETIERVKTSLPHETAFIGFCGAPWTVASYMIAGRGTPDQAPARLFAYRYPEAFQLLIDKLIEASIAYLSQQIETGVDAVQIFDSWAGVLPAREFERWCLQPVTKIISGVRMRHPFARIIAFPRGGASHISSFALRTGANAIGLDTAVDPAWVTQFVPPNVVLQGHLDPLVLIAGGQAQDMAVKEILSAYWNRSHIFNLGHGILPQTPVEHVEALLRQIRSSEA
ncbi:uroporphyrinogen decarboxylase [Rhodoblastus sp.]|uniref:uroporphyrinogen decarboxylase n=1 Tax=Rhodoblastus sp. TaxID=1962975 RepID=UPI003F9555E6